MKSVTTIKFQSPKLRSTLLELGEDSGIDPKDMSDAITSCVHWVRLNSSGSYEELIEGSVSCVTIAKEIASEMGVEPSFPVKRRAPRKKQFDEIDSDEATLESEKDFEHNYCWEMVWYQLIHWKAVMKNSNHS